MIEIETLEELEFYVKTNKAVALYFYNDNCGPCHALRPKIQELIKSKFEKIKLVLVNSLKYPALNPSFEVYANPTLLIFFEGKEYIRKSKYVSISELESEITRLYNLLFTD